MLLEVQLHGYIAIYPLNKRLDELLMRSGGFGEDKNRLLLFRMELLILNILKPSGNFTYRQV
jgi:hypothetical protein